MENITEMLTTTFIGAVIPTVAIICYFIGVIIKKWCKKIANKLIPTINVCIGIILCVLLVYPTTYSGYVNAIMCGLVSALAPTAIIDGIYNQFKKGDE